MYTIKYYESAKGEKPVNKYLDSLSAKARAAFIKRQELLERGLLPFKRPYIAYLRNKIYEFRVKTDNNQHRTLFFFIFKKSLLFTHGFMKKTEKVPKKEIDRALKYKADFEERYKKGGLK